MTGSTRTAALLGAVCAVLLWLAGAGGALAAGKPTGELPPDQAERLAVLLAEPQSGELLGMLGQPQVREWLQHRLADPAQPPGTAARSGLSFEHVLETRLDALRDRLGGLMRVLPHLDEEFAGAGHALMSDMADVTWLRIAFYALVFGALGVGAERLFWIASRGAQRRVIESPMDTVRERVKVVLLRLGFSSMVVLVFATGSLGAFVLFAWPPVVRAMVLSCLLVVVAARIGMTVSRFLLAPGGVRFRMVAIPTPAAWFFHRLTGATVAVGALAWQSGSALDRLGVSPAGTTAIAAGFGLGVVALVVWGAWRGRRLVAPSRGPGHHARVAQLLPLAITVYAPLVWFLFVAGAVGPAWLLLVAAVLPAAIRLCQHVVHNMLRPPGTALEGPANAYTVVIDRGVRTVLLILAALVLVRAWDIDLHMLTSDDTPEARVLTGTLHAVLVFLIADLTWQLIRLAIDTKLSGTPMEGAAAPGTDEEIRRRARLQTLLPILRNILFIAVLVFAILTALSAVGVQIGPLLAGAGVVGVAVGFGAQTLVKDVLAGIFFLLDDAFRVGEYIESGSIRGTVEAFSLRSIKLRHSRGPLHTVPFGDLKAITNYSRDWVIDKLQVGVTYDTDLDHVKRIIKQISRDIMADPELAAVILEPLKSQGVRAMGDFAIQIGLKFKSKPGEQFLVRRVIYDRLKKAFEAEGVHFAYPTVSVAGGGPASAADAAAISAAATQVLAPSRPAEG